MKAEKLWAGYARLTLKLAGPLLSGPCITPTSSPAPGIGRRINRPLFYEPIRSLLRILLPQKSSGKSRLASDDLAVNDEQLHHTSSPTMKRKLEDEGLNGLEGALKRHQQDTYQLLSMCSLNPPNDSSIFDSLLTFHSPSRWPTRSQPPSRLRQRISLLNPLHRPSNPNNPNTHNHQPLPALNHNPTDSHSTPLPLRPQDDKMFLPQLPQDLQPSGPISRPSPVAHQ